MKTITYKFCTKETKTVEVSDEFYATYSEIEKMEQRKLRKQTRVEVSLNYCESVGLEFTVDDADYLGDLIKTTDNETLDKAVEKLSKDQQEIVKKVFYENKQLKEVAESLGISYQAIQNRISKILAQLRKNF
jgi:RNA polymerase sigma factor (sigma-70 family)